MDDADHAEGQSAVPADPDAAALPDAGAAETDVERYHRPRPSLAAPIIWEKPASAAGETQPGDGFFSHTDDDEPKRWHHWRRWGRTSDRTDDESPAKSEKPARRLGGLPAAFRSVRRLVVIIVIAVLAALALRDYVVAPYYVPSASMEPTLHGCPGCNDDHVLVEKLSYRFHDPKPGDVIVFHRPATWTSVPDKVLIKRIIGVSGDKIVIKNGNVYRNGHELDEPYVNQKCKPATTGDPGSTSEAQRSFATIPNGDVFVMGDNRCDSDDSRINGVVPTSDIIGRAFLIVWPVSRWHGL